MPIVRKGKELLVTYKCKLGYHEWVALHHGEYRQRPRNPLSRKGGRKRAQYYIKWKTKYYCNNCGKKRR